MAQTFYPITPTEITAGSASTWVVMDASGSVPANATGVILHCVNTHATNDWDFGLRKNGSTDDRHTVLNDDRHCWVAIGVDANRYFEAYVESTTEIDIYVVGYTMAGVTFSTNADDKSLGSTGDWYPIDCGTEAPSAIGLIFEVVATGIREFGLRKNGSSDDRHTDNYEHSCFGVVIGCDGSQICEGYIEDTGVDFWLVGYITDGCTFNTNATDVSLGSTGSWLDLSALPSGANMGFIEVPTTAGLGAKKYGLRKDGSAEDIYHEAFKHPWGIVECDTNQLIEGKIENLATDFFVVGYSSAVIPPQSVAASPVAASSTVQAPGVSGSGAAPITLSAVAAPSAVQAPSVAHTNQYALASPVQATSAVQSPSASGTGVAPVLASPVAAPSAIQAPSVVGSGAAPISASPVQAPSAVQAPTVAATGSAPISPSPVAAPSAVQAPSVAGSGSAPVSPSPVAAPSAVQAPAVAGSGVALIVSSPIAAPSAVQSPTVSGTGVVSIVASPVASVSEVQAPIVFRSITISSDLYNEMLERLEPKAHFVI